MNAKTHFLPFTLSFILTCTGLLFPSLGRTTTHEAASGGKEKREKWEKVYSENEIEVFSKKVEGSDIFSFSAHGMLNAPIENILTVLRDVEATTKWDESLREKTTITNISDIEAITYNHLAMPWPASDRDFIILNKLSLDRENKNLLVTAFSVRAEKKAAESGIVRATVEQADMHIKSLSAQKTYIEFTIHIDPKGLIPSWVVNNFQRKVPARYLINLEKRAQMVPSALNPGINKILSQYYDLIQPKKEIATPQ